MRRARRVCWNGLIGNWWKLFTASAVLSKTSKRRSTLVSSRIAAAPGGITASLTSPFRFMAASRQRNNTWMPALSSSCTLEQSSTTRGRSTFKQDSTSRKKPRPCLTLNCSGNCFTATCLPLVIFLYQHFLLLAAKMRRPRIRPTNNLDWRQFEVYPVLSVEGRRVCARGIMSVSIKSSFTKAARVRSQDREPHGLTDLFHSGKGSPHSFGTSNTPSFAAIVRTRTETCARSPATSGWPPPAGDFHPGS